MNNMLNLHLRLACTSTFSMPHEICKDKDVVLLRIFEKLDHMSMFGWESETCLEMLLGPLCMRSLKTFPGTVDYTSNNKLQPVRELSELCAQKGYLKSNQFFMRQRLDICRHQNCVGPYQMSPTSFRILED